MTSSSKVKHQVRLPPASGHARLVAVVVVTLCCFASAARAQMAGPLGLSHARWASGTAWQPEGSPLYGVHLMPGGGWMVMLHWNAFAGLDGQRGPRGGRLFMSTNWLMGMASHDLLGGELSGRVMLSGEPVTTTARGYPLLLQSGESYGGEPLHDKQHPHDLFMEIAVQYQRPLAENLAFVLYVAPSGEPALGPAGFPHRASAFFDPLAPITHHWLDSTHISFGVLTAGLFARQWKLDASWFNGREPDQHRYDFELRAPDSGAARLTVNPTASWSLQASYGYLASPEALSPEESVQRITASASFNSPAFSMGNAAALLAWGRNVHGGHGSSDGLLLEGALDFDGHSVAFGRLEYAGKSAVDLAIISAMAEETRFNVATVGAGYLYDFAPAGPVVFGLGVRGALGVVPAALDGAYGGRTLLGGMIFLHLRAPRMDGAGAHAQHNM